MPKKRKKTARISLRIDAKLKEAVEKAATEDHRSLTSLVEQLLTSHLRRRHVCRGDHPKKPPERLFTWQRAKLRTSPTNRYPRKSRKAGSDDLFAGPKNSAIFVTISRSRGDSRPIGGFGETGAFDKDRLLASQVAFTLLIHFHDRASSNCVARSCPAARAASRVGYGFALSSNQVGLSDLVIL